MPGGEPFACFSLALSYDFCDNTLLQKLPRSMYFQQYCFQCTTTSISHKGAEVQASDTKSDMILWHSPPSMHQQTISATSTVRFLCKFFSTSALGIRPHSLLPVFWKLTQRRIRLSVFQITSI